MDWRRLKLKTEYYVDKSIPYALVLLVILIIIEFFYHNLVQRYELYINISHNLILFAFVLDVVFKYIRIRNFKKFLKKCWLDIIVIFPFYLIFRVIEEILIFVRISEELPKWQAVLHVGTEGEEIAKELERVGKAERLERVSRFGRYIRPILRTPRLIKAFIFYEKPKK